MEYKFLSNASLSALLALIATDAGNGWRVNSWMQRADDVYTALLQLSDPVPDDVTTYQFLTNASLTALTTALNTQAGLDFVVHSWEQNANDTYTMLLEKVVPNP